MKQAYSPASEPPPPPEMPEAPCPVCNILIVDDEPSNLLALEGILEPLGQNIVRATSGIEASAVATGKGDDGTTGLLYGGRIDKDDPRVEAYGTIDEAVAALGLVRVELGARVDAGDLPDRLAELPELILRIQRELFVAGAELASNPDAWDRLEDIGLMRHLEVVAARRGLAVGWVDATGGASSTQPHHLHDGDCDGVRCLGTVRTAVRGSVDPWMVVSPNPTLRGIAAPVTVGRDVVGALLVGGYAEGALSDGEVGLLGELLAEAAREVARAVEEAGA